VPETAIDAFTVDRPAVLVGHAREPAAQPGRTPSGWLDESWCATRLARRFAQLTSSLGIPRRSL